MIEVLATSGGKFGVNSSFSQKCTLSESAACPLISTANDDDDDDDDNDDFQ
jgi:hypothetical protein